MPNAEMKTLTIGDTTYEIVDEEARESVGDLFDLSTQEKTNLVAAINEVADNSVVASVNGMTGTVVLTAADVGAATAGALTDETTARIAADAQLQGQITALGNGAPIPVETIAEMTVQTQVYLYTGSETGESTGYWYTYDSTQSKFVPRGEYGGAVTSTTFNRPGVPADDFAVGEALDTIDGRLDALEGDTSGGLTADIKSALLACFANVAWANENGQTYYDALDAALNPPANLSSITCVYTQSGTVYDTASLDDLKADLVVTAHWSDNTTSTVTTYTLSGTLTEGTSTITVAYGGKTTTFTVTVSVFNTAPSIGVEGSSLKANGTTRSNAGACYTNAYTYELDINAFKQTQYYDDSNNYSTTNGALWEIIYNVPNSNSVSFSGYTAVCFYNSNDTYINGASMTFDGTKRNVLAPRYITGYFTLSDNIVKLKFTLPIADINDSYAYWASPLSGVLPVGVSEGDIIFAGSNTPYYGYHNIREVSS